VSRQTRGSRAWNPGACETSSARGRRCWGYQCDYRLV